MSRLYLLQDIRHISNVSFLPWRSDNPSLFCGVILASYWLFLSAMACDWPAEWKEAPCYIKTQSIAYFYCKEDMIILRIHPCPAVYIGDWPRSHYTLSLRETVDDYIQVSHNIQKKWHVMIWPCLCIEETFVCFIWKLVIFYALIFMLILMTFPQSVLLCICGHVRSCKIFERSL